MALYGHGGDEKNHAPSRETVTINTLRTMFQQKSPITMVTAYDYPSARIADTAGAHMLLVGDSLGMVVLGLDSTVGVTMADMIHHCRAANRGRARAFLVGDLPFGSYLSPDAAVMNAARLLKEGGVDAVKLEGGERVAAQAKAIVDAGMLVMGHIGLTPQTATALGGFKCQGKSVVDAQQLLRDALALQDSGVFALVLECVPAPLASFITDRLHIPTIGIGAGIGTSGQVQVFHDLVGLYDRHKPKFARQYMQASSAMKQAVLKFTNDVASRSFPNTAESFSMSAKVHDAFLSATSLQSDKPPSNQGMSKGSAHGLGARSRRAALIHSRVNLRCFSTAFFSRASLVQGSNPLVLSSVAAFRSARAALLDSPSPAAKKRFRLGFVPTMGALHVGHSSLVERALQECDYVAVSIFVNPLQFLPHEDFSKYPRTFEADRMLLEKLGVHLLLAPTDAELYPNGKARFGTRVHIKDADSRPEGQVRPGFFDGVATVVTKLFNIVQPDAAYFGQKDGQQCVVIKQIVRDLNIPIHIQVCPTTREADGLAMSSRNVYLSHSERARAPVVYAALSAIRSTYESGENNVVALRAVAARVLKTTPECELQYLEFASADDLAPLDAAGSLFPFTAGSEIRYLVSIAVKLGSVRLIDNVLL